MYKNWAIFAHHVNLEFNEYYFALPMLFEANVFLSHHSSPLTPGNCSKLINLTYFLIRSSHS